MAEKKTVITTTATTTKETVVKPAAVKLPLFERENYMWMGIGAVVIAVGMLLMSGGKNDSADQFKYDVVYSTMRVTIAPIVILLGLLTEVYAIFKRPKTQQQ